jgi:hypothetical protein
MPLMQGQVGSIPNASLADGSTNFPVLQGKAGEAIMSELHGKWYTQNYRGRLFIGSTLVAGTIIPVNASNLVSTFTLWNPLGSNVNAELVDYDLGLITATAVVGSLAVVFQAGVGAAIAVPTALTSLTPQAGVLGGPSKPACGLYSSATLVGTPTILKPLGISFGTVVGNAGPAIAHVEFDGKVVLPPGTLITTVSTAAQTAAMLQSLKWVEAPI